MQKTLVENNDDAGSDLSGAAPADSRPHDSHLRQTAVRSIYGEAARTYYSHSPCDLFFTTIRPDDPEYFYTCSFISPNLNIYTHSIPYRDACRSVFHEGLHKHDFFELLYVLHGRVYQNIENKRHLYPEGSLCLLNRNVYHQEEFGTEYSVCFLSLSPGLITGLLRDTRDFLLPQERCCRTVMEQFFSETFRDDSAAGRAYYDFIPAESAAAPAEMYHLFDSLTRAFVFPESGSTYRIREIILKIFLLLSDSRAYQTVPVLIGTKTESDLFDRITSCMQETDGRISRTALAARLHYSGSYLNRIVLKYTGLSIFHYGMLFCMQKAADLLTTTDLTAAQAAEQLGFQNRTHFYQKFREVYGMTPGEYRSMHP